MARNLEKYRVRVLCEDKAQYSFIRGFLKSQGVESDRRIYPCRNLPEGTQSGEQFVREHFVNDFRDIARGRENVLLVVVQDIDRASKSPDDAKKDLNDLVQAAGMNGISATDKLLLVFPKRNIESWFEWLQQTPSRSPVSEEEDYKLRHMRAKFGKLGKTASDLYTQSLSDSSVCKNAPDSLGYACESFKALSEVL
jgi:hypothetical protein